MSETHEYERWCALVDRQAAGDTLSEEELAFCERYAANNDVCRQEWDLLTELADLDSTPTERTRALVDSTLERLAREGLVPAAASEVDQGSPARRMRILWASGGLAAAAAVALSLGTPTSPEAPSAERAQPKAPERVELVYASGEVSVDGVAVRGGAAMLEQGSRVEVVQGSACLALDPGIDVCLDGDSRLKLSRIHGAARRLDLERGRVALQLDKQPEGSQLSVVADGVWSTAVGTAFTVAHDEDDGVSTTVLHGKVRVGDGRVKQLVSAHQRARVLGGKAELSAVSRSDESPEWALLGPSELWQSPLSATLELRGVPRGASVGLNGKPVGIAPLSTLVPVGNHRLTIHVGDTLMMRRDFVAAAGQRAVVKYVPMESHPRPSELVQPKPEPRAAVTPRRVEAPAEETRPEPATASQMLGEARALMQQARWSRAAESYQALREAHPASHEARTVLVPLAQLELERLGQPAEALRHAEAYLQGGRGPLAQEARHTRIRALRSLGRTDQEQQAIEEFLRLHPRSFQASTLQKRLGALQRP